MLSFVRLLLCCCIALISLGGCGGGSAGTDGGVAVRLTGTVSNDTGTPLSGIQVTVLETGDDATTDDNGTYSLPVELDSSTVTLLVNDGSNEARAVVRDLSVKDGDVLDIDLALSQSEFTVSVVSVVINGPVVPAPTDPTPTPRPSETPAVVQSIPVTATLTLTDGVTPVRGFKVSVKGESSSDVSDRSGTVSLRAKNRKITLIIENTKDRVSVSLPAVSDSARSVSVKLVVIAALPAGGDISTLSGANFQIAVSGRPQVR